VTLIDLLDRLHVREVQWKIKSSCRLHHVPSLIKICKQSNYSYIEKPLAYFCGQGVCWWKLNTTAINRQCNLSQKSAESSLCQLPGTMRHILQLTIPL